MPRYFSLLLGFLLYAPTLWAHMTVIPHHKEDFEDLATGRDKRGIVLVVTTVFVAGLIALVSFMLRHSRTAKPSEDLRAGQERLKAALMHVASVIRPQSHLSEDALAVFVAATYAEWVGATLPSIETVAGDSILIGSDRLTVRRSAATIEITVVSDVAGASVLLAADGSSAVRVFSSRSAKASGG